jgi:integrase
MLATGPRIGHACAVIWRSIDLDAGTLIVQANVVRIRGTGPLRKP